MKDLKYLEERLGYQFKDKNLIIEALTHKSYKKPYNNERLEFLGDAVLNLIVGEYLYNKFPKSNEGELSKIRASLVNEHGFMKLAVKIDLGEYIFISQAEENNEGRTKPSLLSDAFEAIMGAMYYEVGIEPVRVVVYKLLNESYEKIDLGSLFRDFKTALQEVTQADFGSTPEYVLLSASGPDHKKEFEIAVVINGKEYARAKGKSKKIAQQEAARVAIGLLKGKNNE
jgi:ribonuclease-3